MEIPRHLQEAVKFNRLLTPITNNGDISALCGELSLLKHRGGHEFIEIISFNDTGQI